MANRYRTAENLTVLYDVPNSRSFAERLTVFTVGEASRRPYKLSVFEQIASKCKVFRAYLSDSYDEHKNPVLSPLAFSKSE
jgi:hypothetical protein